MSYLSRASSMAKTFSRGRQRGTCWVEWRLEGVEGEGVELLVAVAVGELLDVGTSAKMTPSKLETGP